MYKCSLKRYKLWENLQYYNDLLQYLFWKDDPMVRKYAVYYCSLLIDLFFQNNMNRLKLEPQCLTFG